MELNGMMNGMNEWNGLWNDIEWNGMNGYGMEWNDRNGME